MNLNEFIGIGLRHQHYKDIVKNKYPLGRLEIHSENFFVNGGPFLDFLKRIRIAYPVSLHGIGLSLGSAENPNINHLIKLKKLIHAIDPFLISEHLS